MRPDPRRLASALPAALLALALAAGPASAAAGLHAPAEAEAADASSGATCLLDRPVLYCAEAVSEIGLQCDVNATHYSCTFTAFHRVAGSTRGPQPGELAAPALLDFGLCNGDDCFDVPQFIGAPCAWDVNGKGCSTSGSFGATFAGPLLGCIEAYLSQNVQAHVGSPGAGLPLAEDSDWDIAEFTTC